MEFDRDHRTIRSVYREGDTAVIRLPMSEVHGLRVALAPCSCRAPKSIATEDTREALRRALGRLEQMR